MNKNIQLTPKLIEILNNILLTIANIGLNINDNVIRIKTCEAINTVLVILSTQTKK